MPLISEWKPSDPIVILVFGQIKIGKTWGACTFPRPVIFDFDKGAATARNPEFVKKYGSRWMFYEEFSDTNRDARGVVKAHSAFDRACMFFDEWMKPKGRWTSEGKQYDVGKDMFDTFVIDSGTTLSEVATNKAVMVLGNEGLSKTYKTAQNTGILIPKLQDFGAERSLVEQFVRMVLSSGKNVILLAHEREVWEGEGNDAKLTELTPMFTGKSAQSIPLMFDEVYNLRSKMVGPNVVRYLQTQPDALRRCGSRYGIPNETPWEYDALKKVIDSVHAAQQGAVKSEGVVAMSSSLSSTVK